MVKRSGYVLGSAGLNGRSLLKLKVPFALLLFGLLIHTCVQRAPVFRSCRPALSGTNQEKVSSRVYASSSEKSMVSSACALKLRYPRIGGNSAWSLIMSCGQIVHVLYAGCSARRRAFACVVCSFVSPPRIVFTLVFDST